MSEGQALPTGAVQIDGYPGYAVDSFGSVYSHRWGRWRRLKGFSNSNGYLRVYLCRDGERARAFVHVLVAKSFVGSQPFDGAEVRHLDGNRLNNCCENLAW